MESDTSAIRQEGWQVVLLSADEAVAVKVAGIIKDAGSHLSIADNADDLSLLLSAMQFDAIIIDERHPDAVAVLDFRKDNPATACVVLTRSCGETGVPFCDLVTKLRKAISQRPAREQQGEPIDIQKFLSRLDSDRSFFNTLASDLLDDLKVKLPELEKAVAAGDAARVEFLAHGLKSVLALFGADEGASTARRLETVARDGQSGDVPGIMEVFRHELEGITRQLRQIVSAV